MSLGSCNTHAYQTQIQKTHLIDILLRKGSTIKPWSLSPNLYYIFTEPSLAQQDNFDIIPNVKIFMEHLNRLFMSHTNWGLWLFLFHICLWLWKVNEDNFFIWMKLLNFILMFENRCSWGIMLKHIPMEYIIIFTTFLMDTGTKSFSCLTI